MKLLMMAIPSKTEFDVTIKRILDKAEYVHLKNNFRDFIDSIKKAILNWIENIFEKKISNYKPSTVSENLSTVFMIVGILVIFSILVFIIIKFIKTFEKNNKITEILGEKIDEKTTPYTLRNKASIFEKEGDYRNAVRYDFIALLLLMHEKNLVYLDETKTNEEVYKYLKKNNFSMVSEFYDMINIFNSAWYGHNACNKDTYIAWQKLRETLWGGVMNYEEKGK